MSQTQQVTEAVETRKSEGGEHIIVPSFRDLGNLPLDVDLANIDSQTVQNLEFGLKQLKAREQQVKLDIDLLTEIVQKLRVRHEVNKAKAWCESRFINGGGLLF